MSKNFTKLYGRLVGGLVAVLMGVVVMAGIGVKFATPSNAYYWGEPVTSVSGSYILYTAGTYGTISGYQQSFYLDTDGYYTFKGTDKVGFENNANARPGYSFVAWSKSYDSSTRDFEFYQRAYIGSYSGKCVYPIYPYWEKEVVTTYLSFSGNKPSSAANSVTGVQSSLSGNSGWSIPSSVNVPSLVGWTFNGYYTSSSGGTQRYNSSGSRVSTASISSDITYYAQWSAKTNNITFAANGGNVTNIQATISHTSGNAIQQNVSVPVRSGYSFAGYWNAASGGTQYYNSAGVRVITTSVDLNAALALYARWSYTITFNQNGAEGNISQPKGAVYEFSYTGDIQSVTLPAGTYKIETWGANGGDRVNATIKGGVGGYSKGTLTLTSSQTFYIAVGGFGGSSSTSQGTSSLVAGGYNGGGSRYGYPGGGGATHIATRTGTLVDIGASNISSIYMVSGGGGSVGAANKKGGYGGGTAGESVTDSYGTGGQGGSQTAAGTGGTSGDGSQGSFGKGGTGLYLSNGFGGAGGGGLYGGAGARPDGSGDDDRGGGGGSGYVSSSIASGLTLRTGEADFIVNPITTGHGFARISAYPLIGDAPFQSSVTVTGVSGATIQTMVLLKTGAEHGGWNTKADGTGMHFDSGALVNNYSETSVSPFASVHDGLLSGDITLYAEWSTNERTVTFVTNGGSTIPSVTVEDGTLLQKPTDPTLTGHTFDGWFMNLSFTTAVTWPMTVSSDVFIYAKWTVDKYSITYNMNGQGTAPAAPTHHTYGIETLLEGVLPQDMPTEQTFKGWSFSNGGEIVTSIPATMINPELFAQWENMVYLNQNGGTGGTEVINVILNVSMPQADMPTRIGYTFQGYFDVRGTTGGTQYYTSTGESVREWDQQIDSVLWARWTANSYTVNLNMLGGEGGTSSVSVTFDSHMPIIDVPTLNGLFFMGYFDTVLETGGKQYYTAEGESISLWDKPNNATLWARWSAVGEYELIFNTTGGNLIETVYFSTADYDLTKYRPLDPVRVGHIFAGWYKDALLTQPFDFRTPVPYSKLTIYADWTVRTNMVTLINNGQTSTFSYTYNDPIPEPPSYDLTLNNHSFDGWFYQQQKIDAYNWEDFLLGLTKNVTIEARYTAYPIISLISNGTTIGTITVLPDSDMITFTPSDPTRVGYTFEGWYKEATSVNPYVWGNEAAPTRDINVYASWKAKRYIVTYDFGGGVHPTATTTTTEWGKSFVFAVPSRAHYHFVGWFTLDGKQLTPNTGNSINVWNTDSDTGTVKVRAHWIPAEYVMRFNTDGGSAIPQVSFGYGELIPIEEIPLNPSKPFALFVGWYTPEGVEFDFYNDPMPAGGITLTAIWAADLSLLVELVASLEELNPADFDVSLYQDFINALTDATQVIDADEPTPDQVRTAYDKLNDAVAALDSAAGVPSDSNAWIFILIGIVLLLGSVGVIVWLVMKKRKEIQ